MPDQIARRRRGQALDDAILRAAWSELEAVGYADFTYQAVAKQAGTSRPVLYRRWPTRAGLAAAAIAQHIRFNPISVPDLGNLRDEIGLLLHKITDRAPPRLLGLIIEMTQDSTAEGSRFLDSHLQEQALQDVIGRALDRGEIDEARLTPRILRAPLSLIMQEAIISPHQISDDVILEIVDQIFLPLVRWTPP